MQGLYGPQVEGEVTQIVRKVGDAQVLEVVLCVPGNYDQARRLKVAETFRLTEEKVLIRGRYRGKVDGRGRLVALTRI